MSTSIKLKEFILSIPIINTHSHHVSRETVDNGKYKMYDGKYNLDTILCNSYVSWAGVSFDSSYDGRERYLSKVRYKHYFKALEKALSELYELPDRITADNWDEFNRVIEQKDQTMPLFDLLREKCRYERIILDAIWEPGMDWGRPDLFVPTFRINAFLNGYNRDHRDMDDMSIDSVLPQVPGDIDEYIEAMREIITGKVRSDSVAIKSANAYERGLDYFKTTRDKAQRVFECKPGMWTDEDVSHFQNYVFYNICDIATELDIPFQIHAGLGLLKKTNAIQMVDVINEHPDTKFVLFHGGYPWTQDLAGMLHYYPNVYSDICWLPLVSPTASEFALSEMLEIATSDKVFWGCDTLTYEESFGARDTMSEVVANVLSSKVDKGYYSMSEAELIIRNILFNNPNELYRLNI